MCDHVKRPCVDAYETYESIKNNKNTEFAPDAAVAKTTFRGAEPSLKQQLLSFHHQHRDIPKFGSIWSLLRYPLTSDISDAKMFIHLPIYQLIRSGIRKITTRSDLFFCCRYFMMSRFATLKSASKSGLEKTREREALFISINKPQKSFWKKRVPPSVEGQDTIDQQNFKDLPVGLCWTIAWRCETCDPLWVALDVSCPLAICCKAMEISIFRSGN